MTTIEKLERLLKERYIATLVETINETYAAVSVHAPAILKRRMPTLSAPKRCVSNPRQ